MITRERYAENLLAATAHIICAVHDEGPDAVREAVDRALILENPPAVDPVVALVTVLAAQIDPDTTDVERMAWMIPAGLWRPLGRAKAAA